MPKPHRPPEEVSAEDLENIKSHIFQLLFNYFILIKNKVQPVNFLQGVASYVTQYLKMRKGPGDAQGWVQWSTRQPDLLVGSPALGKGLQLSDLYGPFQP